MTDLSQKVLQLYDTLRQLENQFIHQYGHTWGEEDEEQSAQDKKEENRGRNLGNDSNNLLTNTTDPGTLSQSQKLAQPKDPSDDFTESSLQDAGATPGSWSLSLTSKGLTINVIAKRLADFTLFAKDFSRQLYSHNPENLVEYDWDTINDEEPDDGNELDEDEYMVTVPIVSIHQLVAGDNQLVSKKEPLSRLFHSNYDKIDEIRPYLSDILIFIRNQIASLQPDHFHLSALLQQIQPFIPYGKQPSALNYLDFMCICTAFAASSYLCRTQLPFPSTLIQTCIQFANAMLVNNLFQNSTQQPAFIICAGLLSWLQRSYSIFEIALVSLFSIDENDRQGTNFPMLAAAVAFLDVYLSTFSNDDQRHSNQECIDWLHNTAKQKLLDQSKQDTPRAQEFTQALQLCRVLRQVLTLFYTSEVNPTVRKIDVDDVFDLVRNIEKWEQGLPGWAQWNYRGSEFSMVRYKAHLMHNITKILFFRPFCTKRSNNADEETEQTHTRTTFLDLSLAAADRLATCISNLSQAKDGRLDEWEQAGMKLVQDTLQRAKETFPCDEELSKQLLDIKERMTRVSTQ